MEEGKEMKLLPLCTLGLLTVLMPFTVVRAADDSANLLRDPNQLSRNDVRLSGEKVSQGTAGTRQYPAAVKGQYVSAWRDGCNRR